MAAAANAISYGFSLCRAISTPPSSSFFSPTLLPLQFLPFRNPNRGTATSFSSSSSSSTCNSLVLERLFPRTRKLRPLVALASAEVGETLVPEIEAESAPPQSEEGDEPSPPTTVDQTVSVTVSPSDVLTMFFQAEGTINEAEIPTVTKALEETEGIGDLKVQVIEGIASVELTKQTTIQATGVASNLVEVIQSKGFKLQTLNLSFQDEEDFS